MTHSWSSVTTFAACPKKYHWRYGMRLTTPSSTTQGMAVGILVHTGIAAAIRGENPLEAVKQRATEGVATETPETLGLWTTAEYDAKQILKYQLPKLRLERFEAVMVEERLFAEVIIKDIPERVEVIVDALLRNTETGELWLVDWKVRRTLPEGHAVEIDGQLPLYTYFVSQLFPTEIIRVFQVNMLNEPPKPAVLTTKNYPSKAVQASTWEVWSSSLKSLGFDPEIFREEMSGKLRTEEDYTRWIEVPSGDLQERFRVFSEWIRLINGATKSNLFPGVFSGGICGTCPYMKLCRAEVEGANAEIMQYLIDANFVHTEETEIN